MVLQLKIQPEQKGILAECVPTTRGLNPRLPSWWAVLDSGPGRFDKRLWVGANES